MLIRGSVESIIFRNEENGYTVIELDWNGQPITCVGSFPMVAEGELLELEGEFKPSKYGEQFSAVKVSVSSPETSEGIVRYLASGLIKGVGEVTASAIVREFGLGSLDVIEREPARLTKIRGISARKAAEISASVKQLRAMRSAVMYLQKLGISVNLAIKIYKAYGEDTEAKVEDNPYKLVEDIDGVGFITADRIARNMGIGESDSFRLRAGLLYTMREYTNSSGSTYILRNSLFTEAASVLGVAGDDSVRDRFSELITALSLDGQLKEFENDGEKCVALRDIYNTENALAARIIRLTKSVSQLSGDLASDVLDFERQESITLHELQRKAAEDAVREGIAVITGGPGTGKTTIIKCVLSLFRKYGLDTVLCAPTGRAAKRLTEQTGEEAKTIHRLLDLDFKDGRGYFTYNESTKLSATAVIIDEVSMADCHLMHCLLRALRDGTRVVMVGDKDQLPSVSAGNVLSDVICSGTVSVTMLEKIYRQSEASHIVDNAHRINEGEMPLFAGKDSDFLLCERKFPEEILSELISMYTVRIPKFMNIDPTGIQVLSPMRKGLCGVDNLNKQLQELINPRRGRAQYEGERAVLREGDKVMQTVNNYKLEWIKEGIRGETGTGVFNGEIGTVTAIAPSGELSVRFDDAKSAVYTAAEVSDLALSYAISIHKSQGCEFDVVMIPVTGGIPSLFNRNLLYTAVTRAKKLVVLIGSRENIKRMVDNDYTEKRYTMLCDFLREQLKKHSELMGREEA